MEGRVQRTGLDLEQVFRGPLNVFGDGVAVCGSGKQRAEDEEVECSLQELHTRRRFVGHYVVILLLILESVYPHQPIGHWPAIWQANRGPPHTGILVFFLNCRASRW